MPIQNVDKALSSYTTFLQLVHRHLKSYFCKHYGEGTERWNDLFPTLKIISTVPNGWEFKQHSLIRRSAITAGLMGRHVGQRQRAALDRIKFVSEAEAAIVYAADTGKLDAWLQVRDDNSTFTGYSLVHRGRQGRYLV